MIQEKKMLVSSAENSGIIIIIFNNSILARYQPEFYSCYNLLNIIVSWHCLCHQLQHSEFSNILDHWIIKFFTLLHSSAATMTFFLIPQYLFNIFMPIMLSFRCWELSSASWLGTSTLLQLGWTESKSPNLWQNCQEFLQAMGAA